MTIKQICLDIVRFAFEMATWETLIDEDTDLFEKIDIAMNYSLLEFTFSDEPVSSLLEGEEEAIEKILNEIIEDEKNE